MNENTPPVWHGLFAGGCSAVTSRLVTYPPDTIKARLQVQGSRPGGVEYRNTAHAFLTIVRSEGVPGFYRGFGAILATVVPANMCYFGGYEMGKRIAPKNLGLLSDMCTAIVAQTIAGIAFNPIDIIKQKLQTAALRQGGNSSAFEAVQEVYRHQGIRGFWKGFVTMNTLWLPWNLIYLTLYERSKRQMYYHFLQKREQEQFHSVGAVTLTAEGVEMRQHLSMQEVLPLWAFPLCSAACSATASICTQPIDVVKTRLQVLSTGAHSQQLNAWQVAVRLWQEEGLKGFRRGMAARTLTMAAGSAVSWSTYETVKRQLARTDTQSMFR